MVGMSTAQSRELLNLAKRALDDTNWAFTYLALGNQSGHIINDVAEAFETKKGQKILDWRIDNDSSSLNTLANVSLKSIKRRISNDFSQARRIKKLFFEYKFDLVIVCQDGVGGPLKILAEAHNLRVPSVIVPFGHEPKGATFSTLSQAPTMIPIRGFIVNVLAGLFPRWVEQFGSERYFRLPPTEVIYHEFMGTSVPLPWTVNGGRATIALVDSQFMLKNYIAEGVPPEKIRLTGSIGHDAIYDLWRLSSLAKTKGDFSELGRGPVNVVVSFPPSYFPERQDYSEFSSYEELVSNWVQAIESYSTLSTVFQAHPQTSAADLETISKFVDLSTSPIRELIAECDLLITTDSSIIKTALLLQKPVINYDAYGWGAALFEEITAVLQASTIRELREKIGQLMQTQKYAEVVLGLQAESANWGMLDGKAWERTKVELESLMHQSL
jgi:hypothetical protein